MKSTFLKSSSKIVRNIQHSAKSAEIVLKVGTSIPYQEARKEIAFYSYGSSESKMRLYLWCKFLRSSQCILIDKFQRCTCVHVVVVNHGFLFGLGVIQSFVNVQFFIKVFCFFLRFENSILINFLALSH